MYVCIYVCIHTCTVFDRYALDRDIHVRTFTHAAMRGYICKDHACMHTVRHHSKTDARTCRRRHTKQTGGRIAVAAWAGEAVPVVLAVVGAEEAAAVERLHLPHRFVALAVVVILSLVLVVLSFTCLLLLLFPHNPRLLALLVQHDASLARGSFKLRFRKRALRYFQLMYSRVEQEGCTTQT